MSVDPRQSERKTAKTGSAGSREAGHVRSSTLAQSLPPEEKLLRAFRPAALICCPQLHNAAVQSPRAIFFHLIFSTSLPVLTEMPH